MEKKSLYVNCEASKKITSVCEFFRIISYIALLAGAILLMIGLVDNDEILTIIGISVLSSSLITLLVALPFMRGFVTIVESAEYTKTNIGVFYDIKEQE